MDLLCGQRKKIPEAFWALLLSLLLLRRGSGEPGVTGLSKKGQEMEDIGRMMKDCKCCKAMTSLHGSFSGAMHCPVPALLHLQGDEGQHVQVAQASIQDLWFCCPYFHQGNKII